MSGDYAVYSKCGDASMCIEHCGGVWQVKPVADKGKDECSAFVTGGCALEACTSRVWSVWDGKTFHDQPSVKMVTGAEAERAVSGPCIGAPHKPLILPSPPPLTAAACARGDKAAARCRTRACAVHIICTRRCDHLPLRRLLHMLLLTRLPLPTTTREPPPSSSAAPQASTLHSSMGSTHRRNREGQMGAFYTARTAMPPCALNTVEAGGESKICQQRARMHASPLSQVDAHWRLAPHADGSCGMEKYFMISPV